MTTRTGTIVGFVGTTGSGLAQLILVDLWYGLTRVHCDAGATSRALWAAFDGKFLGQEIAYRVDGLGLLESFEPIEGVEQ